MPENTLPLPSTAGPGASAADADAVRTVLIGMYEAYDAGDRARTDRALDPRATVRDSAAEPLTGCPPGFRTDRLTPQRVGMAAQWTGPGAGTSARRTVASGAAVLCAPAAWGGRTGAELPR
ncbi:hypothetical protein GCM10010207_59010 [Streptomyces atratus]|uniref:hypothetical protein n=1 Tax=Streptomyces atratus TaxID=1893 RepID=UPI00167179C9|nr:hypothetical protein [Streptomyces atratus]GGT50743.1 hypothetical protein GCM10010207_59010 [Streptomyces atratus]